MDYYWYIKLNLSFKYMHVRTLDKKIITLKTKETRKSYFMSAAVEGTG